jgi:hypothetical protein
LPMSTVYLQQGIGARAPERFVYNWIFVPVFLE